MPPLMRYSLLCPQAFDRLKQAERDCAMLVQRVLQLQRRTIGVGGGNSPTNPESDGMADVYMEVGTLRASARLVLRTTRVQCKDDDAQGQQAGGRAPSVASSTRASVASALQQGRDDEAARPRMAVVPLLPGSKKCRQITCR